MDMLSVLREDRVVAVIRAQQVADPVGLAQTLLDASVRCVEFTLTTGGALDAIAAASDTGAIVGAGSVLRADQAREAVDAGARFVVSPVFAAEVADAVSDQVPVFLAGHTPTELQAAFDAGATAVKLFPARIGGPKYVADLLGPLPHLPIVPSGGVDEDNARDYLDAGAIAVYSGSNLAPSSAVETGQHDEVAQRAQRFVEAVR